MYLCRLARDQLRNQGWKTDKYMLARAQDHKSDRVTATYTTQGLSRAIVIMASEYRAEPLARFLHAAVGMGHNMFIWGGHDGGLSIFNTSVVERFNVMSTAWQQPRQLHGRSLPEGYRSMAIASDGEKVYMFGGCIPTRPGRTQERLNTLYEIDLISLQCKELVPATLVSPTARSSSRLVHVNKRLVVYGGTTGAAIDELFVFDLNTSECSKF